MVALNIREEYNADILRINAEANNSRIKLQKVGYKYTNTRLRSKSHSILCECITKSNL